MVTLVLLCDGQANFCNDDLLVDLGKFAACCLDLMTPLIRPPLVALLEACHGSIERVLLGYDAGNRGASSQGIANIGASHLKKSSSYPKQYPGMRKQSRRLN